MNESYLELNDTCNPSRIYPSCPLSCKTVLLFSPLSNVIMSLEIFISGYLRQMQKKYRLSLPDDLSNIIALFYPNLIEFRDNSMNLSIKEKEIITNWIMETFNLSLDQSPILSSKLLYDGTTRSEYFNKCHKIPNTICIIKVKDYDHIICFFTSKGVNGIRSNSKRYIDDDKIFLAVIRSCFKNKGPQIWRIKPEKSAHTFFCRYSEIADTIIGFQNEFSIQTRHKAPDTFTKIRGNIAYYEYQTNFKPRMKGNALSGGPRFGKKFHDFEGEIENMNVFTITMPHMT